MPTLNVARVEHSEWILYWTLLIQVNWGKEDVLLGSITSDSTSTPVGLLTRTIRVASFSGSKTFSLFKTSKPNSLICKGDESLLVV